MHFLVTWTRTTPHHTTPPPQEDEEGDPDELAEAQAELAKKEEDYGEDIEALQAGEKPAVAKKPKGAAQNIFGPVFVQAFTLTFVAEWGDRSQIATIVLAAQTNPYGVTLGGIFGHSICTGSAVLIGKVCSKTSPHTHTHTHTHTQSVANTFTPRHVNLFGGALFLFFGLLTAYQLMSAPPPTPIPHHSAIA